MEKDARELMFDKFNKASLTYILENRVPRVCRTYDDMAMSWYDGRRHVRSNYVEGVHLSTVFLPIDHKFFRDGPPVVFETMIFGGDEDGYQMRYTNWDAAVLGHREVLHELKRKEWDRLYGDLLWYMSGLFIPRWFINNVVL